MVITRDQSFRIKKKIRCIPSSERDFIYRSPWKNFKCVKQATIEKVVVPHRALISLLLYLPSLSYMCRMQSRSVIKTYGTNAYWILATNF